MKEIAQSLRSVAQERVSSPVWGTFILSWLLWNWDIVLFLLVHDSKDAHVMINFIQDAEVWHTLVGPFFSALLYILLYDKLLRPIQDHVHEHKYQLKIDKLKHEEKLQEAKKELSKIEAENKAFEETKRIELEELRDRSELNQEKKLVEFERESLEKQEELLRQEQESLDSAKTALEKDREDISNDKINYRKRIREELEQEFEGKQREMDQMRDEFDQMAKNWEQEKADYEQQVEDRIRSGFDSEKLALDRRAEELEEWEKRLVEMQRSVEGDADEVVAEEKHSYTKLDEKGNDLPDDATDWVMVRDNNKGLVWEIKTSDSKFRDKEKRFTWEESFKYAEKLNKQKFGGFSDWRVPDRAELKRLVDKSGREGWKMNSDYFNDMPRERWYWSASSYAGDAKRAWCVFFKFGGDHYYPKSYLGRLRVVRGGQ